MSIRSTGSIIASLRGGSRALALAAALACAGIAGEAAAQEQQTFKLAITHPLTGIAASQGESATKAVNLAVEQINGSGMIGEGVTLEPFFYDSQAKPDIGVRALQQAISIENIPFILTGYSGVSRAQAPIAEREERVLVNVGGASPALSDLSPWFFNAIPLTHLQLPILVRYLAEEEDHKSFALIYRDDDLGRGIQGVFAPAVENFGGSVVAEESFLPGTNDFRRQLARIRATNPDVVYIGGVATEVGAIISQAASLGLTPRWSSYGAYNHQSTIELGGENAEGGVYTNPSTFDADLKPYPAYTEFEKAWNEEYGSMEGLDYVAAQYYLGTYLYANVLKSLLEEGVEPSTENIRQRLEEMTFEGTVAGDLTFNEQHDAITSIAIYKLQEGAFVPVTVYSPDMVSEVNEELGGTAEGTGATEEAPGAAATGEQPSTTEGAGKTKEAQ